MITFLFCPGVCAFFARRGRSNKGTPQPVIHHLGVKGNAQGAAIRSWPLTPSLEHQTFATLSFHIKFSLSLGNQNQISP
jgi:hypothetical protein